MRQIEINTETYAAIWADRRPGEETEDAIIRRKFGVEAVTSAPTKSTKGTDNGRFRDTVGFADWRHGVYLEEGFEIFRTYKGTEYRAKATDGRWLLLNTGRTYSSLNQLSRAVSGNVENAWTAWYFLNQSGLRQLINEKRKRLSETLPVVERRL